jgi:tRNA(fMet)-specific endonuclease VapC
MIRYLVDTDWAIHYLNGHASITARLQALEPEGLALSVVSLAELYEGVLYSTKPAENEQALKDFLGGVQLIGVDEATARRFGQERGRLRAAGRLIGDVDLLIGATALANALTLLTNNARHFERLEGIAIESLPASV